MFLSDLKSFVSENVGELQSLTTEAEKCEFSEEEIDTLYNYEIFILLYADDTVICAESPWYLQNALDAMNDYCQRWKLKINCIKTKIMIFFSRRKVCKLPTFTYNGKNLDIVFDFQYPGLKFNYNKKN